MFSKCKIQHQQIGLGFKNETIEMLHLGIALYGAENWTLRKEHQNYLESFQMRYGRRMEIRRNDQVKNKEVLERINEERNIL